MSHYKHLSINERESLLFLLNSGRNISEIARILGRNKSTISRELKRNSTNDCYSAVNADKSYHTRRKRCRRNKCFDNPNLKTKVQDLFLNCQWSPEEIANRLKYEKSEYQVSYNTIYRAIYDGTLEPGPLPHGQRGIARKLRHRGKTRHKSGHIETRGKIVISHTLEERPAEAETREVIGHWEADTVIGKTGSECVVTLVDRCSRFLLADKAEKKSSKAVKDTIISLFKAVPPDMLKTITSDRGKEFSRHAEITEELNDTQFYFPQPHAPWLRGTNENTNGLFREYLPKGADICNFTNRQIEEFVHKLNTRPRKCLGWKTPYEIFYGKSLHLT